MGIVFTLSGLFFAFELIPLALGSLALIFIGMIIRSFEYDDGYYVPVDRIIKDERTWRGDFKWKAK
jgi:cytochrome aa3-600 menaquinol oxidase subunit 1